MGHPFGNHPDTIWKYGVSAPGATAEHQIPAGAEIVHVGIDPGGDGIALWARVEQDANRVTRRFTFVGTGDKLPKGSTYLGSAVIGSYAWHVVELP